MERRPLDYVTPPLPKANRNYEAIIVWGIVGVFVLVFFLLVGPLGPGH